MVDGQGHNKGMSTGAITSLPHNFLACNYILSKNLINEKKRRKGGKKENGLKEALLDPGRKGGISGQYLEFHLLLFLIL